jgi:hypothetical protein
MIDAEPTPAGPETPKVGGGVAWFYPVVEDDGTPPEPLSWRERLGVALRVRWRIWWARVRFRLWWVHALRVRLAQLRLRARLLWLQIRHRDRLAP